MKWKVALAAVCVLWVSAEGAEAQNNFTVTLNVSCDDMELRTLTRGLFSRELRDLGDVGVGKTTTPTFEVRAIAIKEKRSWVLSTVIVEPVAEGAVDGLDAEMVAALGGYARTIAYSLERGESTEDLGRHIGLMISSINRDVLKPRRKAMKK